MIASPEAGYGQEASRRHPGGSKETPRRHPGGTQEAPRRHSGDTQTAPGRTYGSRKHLGRIWRSDFIKCHSLSSGMQKLA